MGYRRFGHESAVPDRRSGYCLLRVPGMDLSLQSRFVPPVRLPALPGGGTLCRAYRARAWPRALRGGAVRAPDCAREATPRGPCDMSWNVMFLMHAGHELQPFQAHSRHVRQMLRIVRPASPASRLRHGSLLSIRLRPALPAAGKRVPVSRVSRVRARLRAFRGGAVRAPDCARETVKAADTPLPLISRRFFSPAPARTRKRPPDAASFRPILP